MELLLERTRRTAWVRVVPENGAALGLYAARGFERADDAEQRSLNEGQPRAYVWLRRSAE